jgi:hypothetical protein
MDRSTLPGKWPLYRCKKAWNQCVRELDRAINDMNVSGRNDPSDDEELAQDYFALFAKHVYVEYWHSFAKQNNLLFQSMNSPLPEGAFKESTPPSSIFLRFPRRNGWQTRLLKCAPLPREPGSAVALGRVLVLP